MQSNTEPTDWLSLEDSYGDVDEVPSLLASLITAVDRDEASGAALDVIDRATYQGTAVSQVAPAVVSSILLSLVRRSTSWRADALSVLDAIARACGAWRKAGQHGDHPATGPEVEWERDAFEQMSTNVNLYRALARDADAEVRSIAYHLIASASAEPGADFQLLVEAFGSEPDVLTRACIAESAIRLASRSAEPELNSLAVNRAREWLANVDPVVRFRTARSLIGAGIEAIRAQSLAAMDRDAPTASKVVWPSEV